MYINGYRLALNSKYTYKCVTHVFTMILIWECGQLLLILRYNHLTVDLSGITIYIDCVDVVDDILEMAKGIKSASWI